MAVNKTAEFEETEIQLAAIAKALSHPARIRILKILTGTNACMCGDIVDLLPLAQATVSQHLKELKKSGLIKGDIEGPRVCYCINPEVYEKAKLALTEFFKQTGEKCGSC